MCSGEAGKRPTGAALLIRLEDNQRDPAGWPDLPRDHEFTPWRDDLPPGTQSGTFFKSVRTTDDGREIWTWGGVDAETRAAGWKAGGGRVMRAPEAVGRGAHPGAQP